MNLKLETLEEHLSANKKKYSDLKKTYIKLQKRLDAYTMSPLSGEIEEGEIVDNMSDMLSEIEVYNAQFKILEDERKYLEYTIVAKRMADASKAYYPDPDIPSTPSRRGSPLSKHPGKLAEPTRKSLNVKLTRKTEGHKIRAAEAREPSESSARVRPFSGRSPQKISLKGSKFKRKKVKPKL